MDRNRLQQYQHQQQKTPLEKKKRDLAFLVQANFPDIPIDISASSFQQPKVNQLLDSMLVSLSYQSVFTLPEDYFRSRENIFQATSVLMSTYMNKIRPPSGTPMWILLHINSSPEATFDKIHALFTFICNIKSFCTKFIVSKKVSCFYNS